jgi:membrane-associated phospholipid phosphatase
MRKLTIGKNYRVLGLEIRFVDALLLAAILVFSIMAAAFRGRVDGWLHLLVMNAVIAAAYVLLAWLSGKARSRVVFFLLRAGAVQLLFVHLFDVARKFQLVLWHQWNDPAILSLEHAIFGFQPTVWLQQFVNPALTEWMMFAYVIYVPIYPVLGAIIYFRYGREHLEDYLLTLALTNLACDLGFILYPVAGPLHVIREQFTVPLRGGWFTAVAEYIRQNIHAIGGTIPSPHCAIATVMWVMAWRYQRWLSYVLAPIIVTLYASTVYGRFHYISDTVIGIATALAVLWLVPHMVRGWNRIGAGDTVPATVAVNSARVAE